MSFLPTPTHTPFTLSTFPSVPLTTTFVKPLRCTGIYLPSPRNVYMMDEQSACLPTGFKTDEKSFFSPGIACPSGYWSACSDSAGVSTITTVTCCPIYRSDVSLSCVDPLTLSNRWANLFCTWMAPESGAVITVTWSSGGSVSKETPTVAYPGGVNAFGIRMVHQSSDLFTASSTTATASPTTTAQSDTQSNTAEPNTPPGATLASISPPANNSSLGTGAIVAIGVVIPLLAILTAIGFFLWWRRRKATGTADVPFAQMPPPVGHGGYPVHSDYKYVYTGTAPADPYPQEMPAGTDRAEMAAGYYGSGLPSVYNTPQELPATTTRGPERESGVFNRDRI
ncbi:hypothetical protein QBC35DRAFT_100271 [Podospora australis]|uniref:Uncharacterized protein n=1 Tax=Podospora australis TaxID=1536484 RepID=A0AAN6X5G4_9PEZI|nr:hypothetical protein QBC35DRAFT_100271 [Podospora australis]